MSLSSFSAQDRARAGITRGYHRNYDAPVVKIYWSIGEVAKMFSVTTSLIRFWLQEFGMDVKKNKKGNRQFTSADIGKLRRAYYLVKVKRFTLAGAKLEMERASVDVRGEQA